VISDWNRGIQTGNTLDITSSQSARLQRLLDAGFRFVTIERVDRYLGVERDGFVALLDPSEGRLRVFSQVGYRLGQGVAMLVERRAGKAFVWHDQEVPATAELLEGYWRFRAELEGLLKEE
jgi:hypothetical protein